MEVETDKSGRLQRLSITLDVDPSMFAEQIEQLAAKEVQPEMKAQYGRVLEKLRRP